MSSLKVLLPGIPFDATYINFIEPYSDNLNAFNSIAGKKWALSQFLTAVVGTITTEYDLGTGNDTSSDYLTLARADYLIEDNCKNVLLKGCSSPYLSPSSVSGLTLWLKGSRYLTFDSENLISSWQDYYNTATTATQGTTGNKPHASRHDYAANWLKYTAQFDDATWTKSITTVTANTANNPLDVTPLADTLNESASATGPYTISQTTVDNIAKAVPGRFSCYVSRNGRNYCYLQLLGTGYATASHIAHFDLVNGVVVSSSPSVQATIEALPNSWYRCTIQATSTASGTVTARVGITTDGATTGYPSAGGAALYLFGAQFNEVSASDNTYLANVGNRQFQGNGGQIVPRFFSGDYLTATTATYYGNDFTLFAAVNLRAGADGTVNHRIISNESFNANGIALIVNGAASPHTITIRTNQAGANTSVTSSASLTAETTALITVVKSGGTATIYVNGVSVGSGAITNAIAPTNPFLISDSTSTEGWNGDICELIVYNTGLGSTDRQAIEAVLMSEWVTTPAASVINLETSDLVGSFNQDYVTAFTATSDYRYWWAQFVSPRDTTGTRATHSKLFFGTAIDTGVEVSEYTISREVLDAVFLSSSGDLLPMKQQHASYKIDLSLSGHLDTAIDDLHNIAMPVASRSGVFLYAPTYTATLGEKILLYGNLSIVSDNRFYKIDCNYSTLKFIEELG